MRIECYFVAPINYFNDEEHIFYLIPDNLDPLPLDIIKDYVVLQEYEISQKNNQLCRIIKAVISQTVFMEMMIQINNFISLDCYEKINKINPILTEEIANDVANFLSMQTVAELQISSIYAGRSLTELVLFYPELEGKIEDITIL